MSYAIRSTYPSSDSLVLAHILRLLATHHIFRELSPNVFTFNRISSLMDSGKTLEELDDVFNAAYPPRAKAKELVAIKADGHVDLIQDA